MVTHMIDVQSGASFGGSMNKGTAFVGGYGVYGGGI